jgi:phosphoribosylanthranilate isomerase
MDGEGEVKVKVCGITNTADAQAAVEAGADFLGFIFFRKSPRYVAPERVREILEAVDRGRKGVLTVGVFVNETAQSIAQILDFCRLDLAQLHGEEPPTMLGLAWRGTEPDLGQDPDHALLYGRAYKALRPGSAEEATDLVHRYVLPLHQRREGHIPAFLLDAHHPQLRGGTGKTGDWNLAASLATRHSLLLAGGLDPSNVARAVDLVRPWGVDVASGVERSPGQKDHAAVRAFISAVRRAELDK